MDVSVTMEMLRRQNVTVQACIQRVEGLAHLMQAAVLAGNREIATQMRGELLDAYAELADENCAHWELLRASQLNG